MNLQGTLPPFARELIVHASSLTATSIVFEPGEEETEIRILRLTEVLETTTRPNPEMRRLIDDLKFAAEMPVGRDKPHAGRIRLAANRAYGAVLVLTDPIPGNRERCVLRLQMTKV